MVEKHSTTLLTFKQKNNKNMTKFPHYGIGIMVGHQLEFSIEYTIIIIIFDLGKKANKTESNSMSLGPHNIQYWVHDKVVLSFSKLFKCQIFTTTIIIIAYNLNRIHSQRQITNLTLNFSYMYTGRGNMQLH